jgi:cell division protein FtsB
MNEVLEKSFIDLREANSKYSIEVLKQKETIDQLKKENKKLRDCVNYYANETTDIIAVKARKTLEEINKLRGKNER